MKGNIFADSSAALGIAKRRGPENPNTPRCSRRTLDNKAALLQHTSKDGLRTATISDRQLLRPASAEEECKDILYRME